MESVATLPEFKAVPNQIHLIKKLSVRDLPGSEMQTNAEAHYSALVTYLLVQSG